MERLDLENRLRHAEAINRMARVITHDGEPSAIRQAMVQIIGETLDVDRTLIYDVRLDDDVAEGLCEWLNPAAEGVTPTLAIYPTSMFAGGIDFIFREKTYFISHADQVHPSLEHDGSAPILHEMKICSLLWFPFDFEERRVFALAFNQVRHRRDWTEQDLGFVSRMADMVSMAHMRMRLAAQRRQREQHDQQQQRLDGLGLLAGGIAHDFNNLLTAILGSTALAAKQVPADSEARALLDDARQAAESAGELCKQLLTYAGRTTSAMSLLDLPRTVHQLAHLMRVSVSRNADVEYDLGEEPRWILGDRVQIQQVVLNLLTNASEALPEGFGTISVRVRTMSTEQALAQGVRFVAAPPEGNVHCLLVEDSGMGVEPEALERIFEPFYTTKEAGHGMGLAAVHRILAAHRAGIRVESVPGQWTSFLVAFPEASGAKAPEASIEPRRSGRATVLVVDDQEMVRSVCETSLRMADFDVVSAASGYDALRICDAAQSPIAVAVIDLGMPGMDGRQTILALREAGHEFPVLLISAYGVEDALPEGDADRISYLQKPFSPGELQARVTALLPGESISARDR